MERLELIKQRRCSPHLSSVFNNTRHCMPRGSPVLVVVCYAETQICSEKYAIRLVCLTERRTASGASKRRAGTALLLSQRQTEGVDTSLRRMLEAVHACVCDAHICSHEHIREHLQTSALPFMRACWILLRLFGMPPQADLLAVQARLDAQGVPWTGGRDRVGRQAGVSFPHLQRQRTRCARQHPAGALSLPVRASLAVLASGPALLLQADGRPLTDRVQVAKAACSLGPACRSLLHWHLHIRVLGGGVPQEGACGACMMANCTMSAAHALCKLPADSRLPLRPCCTPDMSTGLTALTTHPQIGTCRIVEAC